MLLYGTSLEPSHFASIVANCEVTITSEMSSITKLSKKVLVPLETEAKRGRAPFPYVEVLVLNLTTEGHELNIEW